MTAFTTLGLYSWGWPAATRLGLLSPPDPLIRSNKQWRSHAHRDDAGRYRGVLRDGR